jgi:hypothetical protein
MGGVRTLRRDVLARPRSRLELATTPPTTLGGAAAVLRFVNLIEDEGGEWPGTDTIGAEGMALSVAGDHRDRDRDDHSPDGDLSHVEQHREISLFSRTRARSRVPRRSRNGTREERAAKAVAKMGAPGAVVALAGPSSDRGDWRKLRGNPLREKSGLISPAVTIVGKMYTADLREEPSGSRCG